MMPGGEQQARARVAECSGTMLVYTSRLWLSCVDLASHYFPLDLSQLSVDSNLQRVIAVRKSNGMIEPSCLHATHAGDGMTVCVYSSAHLADQRSIVSTYSLSTYSQVALDVKMYKREISIAELR